LVGDVTRKVNKAYEDCEQSVRKAPGKSILITLAAGYCLHRLPVRSSLVARAALRGFFHN
jgi:hypothetical protein